MNGNPTRIAVLTPHHSTEFLGGVEVFNAQLQRALDGVEIFSESTAIQRSTRWNLESVAFEGAYRAWRVANSFLNRHRTEPFDLVISNGLCGWPLSVRRLRVPMVQVYHFTMAGLARRALSLRGAQLTTGTVGAFFDGLAGRGKHVVTVSHGVRQEVKRYYGLEGEVIPNSVDTTLFRRQDKSRARETLGLPQDAKIGLFVGRSEFAKGFDIFLEVARSMREILFLVVGHDSINEPNVRSIADVPHSQMPNMYSAADFFFLPSRYEGFNISVLEAVACGLPIVVSHAAYPLAEDPSIYGYVAKSMRPSDFVRGIRELEDWRDVSEARRNTLDSYSADSFRRNWRQLVDRLTPGS